MAKDKKSVLLYCDLIHTVEKMDDETAGKFFKHYLRYINDLNPKTDNLVVDISFESVKQNLKRDLIKWESRATNSRNNGKLGGRPASQKEPKEPSGLINNLTEPKEPVTDTVTVTVTDTVTVKDINKQKRVNDFNTFWNTYNKKTDSSKCSKKFLSLPQKDIDKILLVTNDYVSSTPDKKYRKNPITWLNGECWNDEILSLKTFEVGQAQKIINKKITF